MYSFKTLNTTNALFKSIFIIVLALFTAMPVQNTFAQKEAIDGGITLDFEDVEIRDLVRFMAESTGMNFIVDNRVKGKVTVISPTSLDKSQALEVFETLIVSSGFTITPTNTDGVFRILPQADAAKTPVDIVFKKSDRRPSQLGTEIIGLNFANIEDVMPIIKPLLSPQSKLTSYLPNNTLIVTETHANLQCLKKLIKRVDTPTGDGSNITLLPLKYADAIQVSNIVDRIFSSRRLPKGSQKVEVIPEAASNSLLVVADKAQLNEIRDLVKKLDGNANDDVRAVEIVYLRHANAKDLEEVIDQIVENAEDAKDDTTDEEKSSSVISNTTFRSNVSVVADESINALVISAEPSDMVTLKAMIDNLDIRRLQVYIEALVMEVSADVSDKFGVEWRSADDFTADNGIKAFGGQNLNGSINSLANNPLSLPSGVSFGVVGPSITYEGTEYANIGFLVNALKSDSNVNVLATPQLMTLDNEEAKIIVGDTVPFVTGSFTTNTDSSSNPFQTIERQDVGLTLEIKPQISENGFVRLNIYQEISSVAESQGEASDLVTRKRSLQTSVVVPNQSMLALGGLIREDITETHSRVPCLSSLWGVGEFFKSSDVRKTKTNLMVFIRPVIINTYGDAETITHRKYLNLRKLQLDRKKMGNAVVPEYDIPEHDIVPLNMRYTKDQFEQDEQNGIDPLENLPRLPALPKPSELPSIEDRKKAEPMATNRRTPSMLTTFTPPVNDAVLNAIEPAVGE